MGIGEMGIGELGIGEMGNWRNRNWQIGNWRNGVEPMIYDHDRGALQSNQQNMHGTAYCVMTIIVNQGTKKQNKKEQKNKKNYRISM